MILFQNRFNGFGRLLLHKSLVTGLINYLDFFGRNIVKFYNIFLGAFADGNDFIGIESAISDDMIVMLEYQVVDGHHTFDFTFIDTKRNFVT